jgi:ferritin-like metal-binding protein YciE
MLDSMAARLERYPALRGRIVEHIEETRWQRGQLAGCLQRRGDSPSLVKDMAGKMVAFGQGVSGMFASDEVVKGAMAGYVFENMEIASYTVLIAAAQAAGDAATEDACRHIIAQEQAMAAWLLEHLPAIATAFLTRAATPGLEAKV